MLMYATYLNAQTKIETVSLRNDSTSINYIRNGKGKTTLLFIHGWGINKNYWEEQISHFSENYDVLAIDLPGFGHSTTLRSNWSIEEYSKDVIAFIEKLNLKNVVLIGHSMSGDVVLETAIRNHKNIKGIIGIDNFKYVGVEFSPEEIKQYQSFLQMMDDDFENMAAMYADQYLFHPSTDSLVRANVISDFINSNREVAVATLKEVMVYGMKESEKLQELPLKLYLLNSDATPTNTPGLEKHCKNSFEVFEIHATGHYPMNEKPEEFNRMLEGILEEM